MARQYQISQLFKTSWQELTLRQMLEVVALSGQLSLFEEGSKDYGLTVISILRALRKNKNLVSKIDVEQAVDCFNDINFFKRTPKGEFVTPWLYFPIKKFQKKFHGIGVTYYRPEMSGDLPMYNRSFDQLVFADTAFSTFCATNHLWNTSSEFMDDKAKKIYQDEMNESICALIAVLYTDHKDFDAGRVAEEVVPIVKRKLKPEERVMLLHTFANIRTFLIARCPNLFPQQEKDDDDESDDEKPTPVSTGQMWMNLRYDLAETSAFEGFDTARNAMIYDALDYLERRAIQAAEERAKVKQSQHA